MPDEPTKPDFAQGDEAHPEAPEAAAVKAPAAARAAGTPCRSSS